MLGFFKYHGLLKDQRLKAPKTATYPQNKKNSYQTVFNIPDYKHRLALFG